MSPSVLDFAACGVGSGEGVETNHFWGAVHETFFMSAFKAAASSSASIEDVPVLSIEPDKSSLQYLEPLISSLHHDPRFPVSVFLDNEHIIPGG